MQQTITINYNKIAKQIAEIENLAMKNKWMFHYDADLDSLYYSSKEIDSSYALFTVNGEYSLYVDKDSNVGGIFIEYYRANLASHDTKFKPFAKLFTPQKKAIETSDKERREKKDKEILLSEVLKAEILATIIQATDKDNKQISIPI